MVGKINGEPGTKEEIWTVDLVSVLRILRKFALLFGEALSALILFYSYF